MAYFGLTHPCPYCRFHFTQRVSRNDMDWESLDEGEKNWFGDVYNDATGTRETQRISESEIYPLEYLFFGGKEGPKLIDKISSITDATSLLLFFWKIHNTVTSSVAYGTTCRTDEKTDVEPWNCKTPPSEPYIIEKHGYAPYEANVTTTTRNLGRTFPTARRFAHWLKTGETGWKDARAKLEAAHTKMRELDWKFGSKVRQDYWTSSLQQPYGYPEEAEAVMSAIVDLDEAMLETNLLITEYELDTKPNCDTFAGSMNTYEPLNITPPLVDGNFPLVPDKCNRNSQPSVAGFSVGLEEAKEADIEAMEEYG